MTISILLPVFLGVIGIFNEDFLFYALVSTMATGALQVLAGAVFWIINRESLDIKLYFSGVVGFFLLAYFLDGHFIVWFMPPALCVFLFWIVFTYKIPVEPKTELP